MDKQGRRLMILSYLFLATLIFYSCARPQERNQEEYDTTVSYQEHTIEYYDSLALKQLEDHIIDDDRKDYLNFGFYSKEYVPDKVFSKQEIKRLTIFHTNLRKVPDLICGLTNVENLDLSHNRLSDISAITCLTNLEFLDVSQNRLERLPINMLHLSKLYSLNISQNKFKPQDLTQLPANLTVLHLANNRFVEVPKAVFNLKQLEFLNLTNNDISVLPLELLELKNLKRILVYGNPMDIEQLNEFRSSMKWCEIEI